MARDLAQFQRPLAADAGPDLSPIDPRWSTISDLADRRRFGDAADRVEELLGEYVFDIRPISVFLFEAFLEGGFSVLPGWFSAIAALLGQNFSAVGPSKRREEHFSRRLAWLFDSTLDALKYHSLHRTADWARWNDGLEPGVLADAIERAGGVTPLLSAEVFKAAHMSLVRLLDEVRRHGEALSAARAPAPEEPAAPASAPAQRAEQAAAVSPESLEPVRRKVELVVSHAFIDLACKLRAFETLIEKGQHEKAALVGDDILATLDGFDPRAYFPELFGTFSSLLSENINTLAGHWGDRDSPAWKALVQFYRVDLKRFVDS